VEEPAGRGRLRITNLLRIYEYDANL